MKKIRKDKNKKNKDKDNQIIINNNNNFSKINNHSDKQNNDNNEINLSKFFLTPLEKKIINNIMPQGFRLETEENLLGILEEFRNRLDNKEEINEENDIHINEYENNINNNQMEAFIKSENDLNVNNNSEHYKIMMKCYGCFNRLKLNQNFNFFYLPKFPDSPSLSNIEKKIKNMEYKAVDEFHTDLRKLWNYQFKNYAKEPKIYQNIYKISILSEDVCKELYNENDNNKEDLSNIKKRTLRIKKDLEEIYGNKTLKTKKMNNNQNIYEKKSLEEINHLGSLIRTLNKQQLRGIIPILADKKRNNDVKMLEFDIEQLPPDKYINLEKYVQKCINKNNLKNDN